MFDVDLLHQHQPFHRPGLSHDKPAVVQHIIRPLGYKRVYLPLYKVADTPFPIQVGELLCL